MTARFDDTAKFLNRLTTEADLEAQFERLEGRFDELLTPIAHELGVMGRAEDEVALVSMIELLQMLTGNAIKMLERIRKGGGDDETATQ